MKCMLVFVVASVLVAGCVKEVRPKKEEPETQRLTLQEALEIAVDGECTLEGELTDSYFYNENTRTWWIGLDIERPGCNPACVVSADSKTAEINWRCTGALPSKQTACEPEQREQGACIEIYAPVCGWFGENVQCVAYPCAQTYPNSCFACRDLKVEYWTQGGCPSSDVVDFDSCAAAGYPVMESYPRQCRAPDGRTFVEETPVGAQLVEVLEDECSVDEDCVTPDRWLVRSDCPYTMKCMKGVCMVVCPR